MLHPAGNNIATTTSKNLTLLIDSSILIVTTTIINETTPTITGAQSDETAAVETMTNQLSTTEYAVLGMLAEGPSHGFALSKSLQADGEIGRVCKVRRPLVYRALDRLVETGYAEPVATEKGDAGPQRVIHRITRRGRYLLRSG